MLILVKEMLFCGAKVSNTVIQKNPNLTFTSLLKVSNGAPSVIM